MLPDGVSNPLAPQPVPPPALNPMDNPTGSSTSGIRVSDGSTLDVAKNVTSTAKTSIEAAADVMFGDRSPLQINQSRENTPERVADGEFFLFYLTFDL